MNRTSPAKATKTVAWSRLTALLLGEAVLFALFLYLGSDPARRVDLRHFSTWINQTPPAQAVVAAALMIGALGACWLFISTVLYVGARLMRLSRLGDGFALFTLPAVRRMVDGAFAVSIAGTTLLGAGKVAGAATFTRESAPVTVQANRAAPQRLNAHDFDLRVVLRANDDIPEPAGDGGTAETAPPATPQQPAAPGGGNAVGRPVNPGGDASNGVGNGAAAPQAPSDDSGIPDPAGDGTPTPPTTPAPPSTTAPQPAPPAGRVPDRPATPPNAVSRPVNPGTQDDAPVNPPGTEDGGGVDTPSDPGGPTVGGQTTQIGSYVVESGDNFWAIAQRQVEAKLGRTPTNEEVRSYWVKLIEANRGNFRSGNPNLIFPGERFVLPPVD